MDWRSAKLILASTATVVVATQVAKSLYKYYVNRKKPKNNENTCSDILELKNKEINDVILFSDDIVRRTVRVPPNHDLTICEGRELNCFKLIKYIKSARETLDVCMYLITSCDIAEHIIRLGQQHVLVRIVVDSDMANTPPSQVKKLKEFSKFSKNTAKCWRLVSLCQISNPKWTFSGFIQVQTNKKSMLMHHKFCIVDGPKAIKRKNMLKAHAEKLNSHALFTKHNIKHQSKPKSAKGFVMSGSLNWSTQAMISNHESVIVTSNTNIVSKFEKEFESLWVENEPVSIIFYLSEKRM